MSQECYCLLPPLPTKSFQVFFLHYCMFILTVYSLALICRGYGKSFDLSAKKKVKLIFLMTEAESHRKPRIFGRIITYIYSIHP